MTLLKGKKNRILHWVTVGIAVILTFGCLIATHSLMQQNPEKLFLRDQQLKDFDLHSRKIAEREIVVGLVKSTQSLRQNLDFSDHLTSQLSDLLSQQQVTVHSFRTLYGKILGMPQKLEEVIKQTRLLPLLGHNYIAHLFIFGPQLSSHEKELILRNIRLVYEKLPNRSFLSGTSIINQGLNEQSSQIKNRLFPLMFVLCFFLLWVMTGRVMPTLAIFVPSLMASALSLLCIQIFVGSMNMISSVLPLFTFAINASLGLHLLFSLSHRQDFKIMLKQKSTPIALMVGTTFIGLVSLVVSDLAIIRQFALLGGGLILVTSSAHLIFARSFYFLFPATAGMARPLPFFHRWHQLLPANRLTFWSLTIITVMGIISIPYIRLETEAANYFHPEKHPVGQGIKEISKTIFGHPNMEIVLEKSTNWELKDLEKIHTLEKELLLSLGPLYKILSPNQFLLEANIITGVGNRLPTDPMVYPILLGQILSDAYESYYQDHLYRMTLMGPILKTQEFETFNKKVAEILKDQGPWNEIKYAFTGTSYNLKLSQRNLVSVLAVSFFCSLLLITLASFLFNRKIQPTLIFFATNLFPLFVTCLMFKLVDLSFNIATVMTFSIALGLVVDGTFHLQHAHEHLLPEAIWYSVKYPIWASSLVLCLTFGVLAINSFLPIREFALALVINIFMGMIFDLYFLDAAKKLCAPKDL